MYYTLIISAIFDLAGMDLCSEGTQDKDIHRIFLLSLPQQPAIEKMSSWFPSKRTPYEKLCSLISLIVRCVAMGQNKFLCLIHWRSGYSLSMPQVQQGSVRFNSSEEEPHPSPFPFLLYTCSMIRQYLCFRCRNSLAARVRTSVRAEVKAAPTVLQSGDPSLIFIYHTHCKDYSTTHCSALYNSLYCTHSSLQRVSLCSPPHSS